MGRLNKGEEKHVHFIIDLQQYKEFEVIANNKGKTVSAALREFIQKTIKRKKNSKSYLKLLHLLLIYSNNYLN